MPVIAAGIVNKGGRIVLSRQFTDITRIRIEGLLSAFPKLLGGSSSKQYTVVETESVRYVYQPVEELFLVVVTTKSSNIVEDLATLRLMGRLIPEYAPTPTEENIRQKAFEILFAFDEVVTCGSRENVTMDQVMSILEMHSHEEEMALEEKRKAELDAIRHAKDKAKELAQKKRENILGDSHMSGGPTSGGFGASSSISSDLAGGAAKSTFSDVAEEIAPPKKTGTASVGGMALGKQKKSDAAAKMMAEMGVTAPLPASAPAEGGKASPAAAVSNDPITLRVVEQVSAVLNRDGGVSSVDIRGDLLVHVADPSLGVLKIVLGRYKDAFNFKSHPKINKEAFLSQRVLINKEPYPLQQSLGILRWRLQQVGVVKVPISINCWPSDSGVSVEFELENTELSLRNVVIAVPISDAFPTVDQCSVGRYTHDAQRGVLSWHVGNVDRGANDSGTLEVSLNKSVDTNVFFPTRVSFVASASVAGVACVSVANESGEPIKATIVTELSADDYQVA